MSTWLRDAYMRNRSNIVRLAEKMPDEFYDMRPGAQPEVRTFGQQVGHVANFNFLWCSQAKGEKNPNTANLENNKRQENERKARRARIRDRSKENEHGRANANQRARANSNECAGFNSCMCTAARI